MKFLKIFQLEFTYQFRQVSTWLYFTVMLVLAFLLIHGNFAYDARDGYHLLNAPVIIGCVTVLCCVFWLLFGGAVAGDAAARDVQTRMFSLTFTSATSKAEYLGGRFMAAALLNSFILTGVPLGILLTMYLTGIEAAILGPFKPVSYLSSYFLLVLPNAFFATAVQFSMAALSRKAMASYLGGALLFVAAYVLGQVLDGPLGMHDLGTLVDPVGLTAVLAKQSGWSEIELNSRLIEAEGIFLANRILWLLISLGMLALAYFRFSFRTPATSSCKKHSSQAAGQSDSTLLKWNRSEGLPHIQGAFNFKTRLQQLRSISLNSFLGIAKKGYGLYLLGFIALVMAVAMPGNLKAKGVPLLPVTEHVLTLLTAAITNPGKFWILIYLLTVFYAGELVWRERESGLSELSNATPVPEWVLFLSKYLPMIMMLAIFLVFLLIAGILAQVAIGGASVEPGLYIEALFGFQLIECMLFALLALVLHVVVNQKYLAHLIALLAFGCIIYASNLGIEHKLLIFGASPAWTYTSMGGFMESVAAWMWFKAYWISWSLLLAVLAKLLWVRSRETSLAARLQQMRRRFTPATALTAAIGGGLILTIGGIIFYNTNVLNKYENSSDISAGRAVYERRYLKYSSLAQPRMASVSLQVEIYPKQNEFNIQGTYVLVNKETAPIDSVLLAVPSDAETTDIKLSTASELMLTDNETGFLIYALRKPLQSGDTLRLSFKVHQKTRGFTNNGAVVPVLANGTNFINKSYMPVIGYQPYRELDDAGSRTKYGLAPRPAQASLYDLKARKYGPFVETISFNAVVGTDEDQMVVAPGTLRKTWKKGARRYFHYSTKDPIRNEYSFFSAKYDFHASEWRPANGSGKPVAIQIYNNPGHAENIDDMMKSVKASLDHFSKEFGPYPQREIRFVSYPGYGMGNHASPINITAEEGFFLLKSQEDPRGFDLVTAVVAHEVAHQWWGGQLKYAYIEGAGLLSESLAWYSAMGVLEEKYGPDHLKKLLDFLREEYETPRTRAAVPLLQGSEWYSYYRKGPLALYAMSQYIGKDKVNAALSRLLRKHSAADSPLANSLDLYGELYAVTPDSVRYLLHDLFKANTFWDMEAGEASVKRTNAGSWAVTFRVQSRKSVVSAKGLEKELPLKDWIEIGIYAAAKDGAERGQQLYLGKHFIDSKQQTITLTVSAVPAMAGIDPRHLLVDWDVKNNFIGIKK